MRYLIKRRSGPSWPASGSSLYFLTLLAVGSQKTTEASIEFVFPDSGILTTRGLMSEQVAKRPWEGTKKEENRLSKKPYQDPAFRFERVFETMALACGKVEPTNFQCRFHRQSS